MLKRCFKWTYSTPKCLVGAGKTQAWGWQGFNQTSPFIYKLAFCSRGAWAEWSPLLNMSHPESLQTQGLGGPPGKRSSSRSYFFLCFELKKKTSLSRRVREPPPFQWTLSPPPVAAFVNKQKGFSKKLLRELFSGFRTMIRKCILKEFASEQNLR